MGSGIEANEVIQFIIRLFAVWLGHTALPCQSPSSTHRFSVSGSGSSSSWTDAKAGYAPGSCSLNLGTGWTG